jgi:cell wall-associated NlpC family hydrolase
MYLRLLLTFFLLTFLASCSTARHSNAMVTTPKGYTNTEKQEIIAYAEQQLGTRYMYGGKDPRGFDCSGFTSYVLRNFGRTLDATADGQANQGEAINPEEATPGDLVFFKRPGQTRIFHVALVVNNSSEGIIVIHSTTSRGVVRENISRSSYWQPFIHALRRVL